MIPYGFNKLESIGVFFLVSKGCQIQGMKTCSEIRHDNLLDIIKQVGSVQAVADRLEVSYARISQLKTRARHPATGKPRGIGDDTARLIEEKFGLEHGWMDHEHRPSLTNTIWHTPLTSVEWPFDTPLARLNVLNTGDIATINTVIKTLVEARERDTEESALPIKLTGTR